MSGSFSFLLGQIGKAFEVMMNFYIFPPFLSLFDFLIVLLVLHIVITLFVPTLSDYHLDVQSVDRVKRRASYRKHKRGD